MAWGRTYLYREHDCYPQAVEFWSLDTGMADVRVYLGSTLIIKRLGVRLASKGFHSIDLGYNLVGGRALRLYTVVRFTADHDRKPLVYAPGATVAGQATSRDGMTWTAFTQGALGIELIAPLQ
jgi:hypothetical protein